MDADRIVEKYLGGGGGVAYSNTRAFLTMIRACEGTFGPLGYRALFGYRESAGAPIFDGFADHPQQRFSFHQTDGTLGFTTAAGAYQFIYSTWKRMQAKLALPDFSPDSQDRAAIELIAERGALALVESGAVEDAIGRCWPIWASLPGSTYLQPTRSLTFALDAYGNAGGGAIA